MPVLSNENRHEERLSELEKKNQIHDDRIRNLHTKVDDHKKQFENDIKNISSSVEEIRKSQHSQELTNQKMNFTLDSINNEREEERKNKKQMHKENRDTVRKVKFWVLGLIGTIITSMVIAALRMWIGL